MAMALDQVDGRQEARALQPALVQRAGRGVRAGDQHRALREQALEQARQQHRVADVADEELVEHQHPQPPAPVGGDRGQRVALPGMRAQLGMDLAHEAVEVGAVLAAAAARSSGCLALIRRFAPPSPARERSQVGAAFGREFSEGKAVVEQVDQEGLAAADAAPQVQARDRFPPVAAQHPREQAAVAGGARHQRRVDAVEFGQCRMLGRVVLPLAAGDPGGVGLARRRRAGRLSHAPAPSPAAGAGARRP
jgi:hypothetical protein